MENQNIYLALPVLGEYANLEALFSCIGKQSLRATHIYVCVNQYESWWNMPEKRFYCDDNARSLEYLHMLNQADLTVLDNSSVGKGWKAKKGGVGWARKTLMDKIAEDHNEGIIVSMDADTYYPENYLKEIAGYFSRNPEKAALSLPYYHRLNRDETDRLILRYEIYMRYYAMNMLRIGNPYAFTALGSAMAIPLRTYRKIGGITPVKSGEDFYLLQKLVKNGSLGNWADTTAFPSSRLSDRVLFGTGPALLKGAAGNWTSYPLYPSIYFDLIKQTYDLFPDLYDKNPETPMDTFLKEQFKVKDLWEPIRKNYKDRENFVRACVGKVDGLRVLQFLRYKLITEGSPGDEMVLRQFFEEYFNHLMSKEMERIIVSLDFDRSPVEDLDQVRNFLRTREYEVRKNMENSN